MRHTRYKFGNVVLLVAGILTCCLNQLVTGMAFGFGDIGVTGLRRLFVLTALFCVTMELPAFVLMFRWCRVGSNALWILTISCLTFALMGGWAFTVFKIPIVLMVSISGISSAINARS